MAHSRRGFLGAAAGSVAALSLPRIAHAAGAPEAIQAEVAKRHDEGVLRLQQWIREPAIAAENRGMDKGCETMLRLARERLAGSYPGYVFTNPPLKLPAGHFGLGHGGGAHAPDEYLVIESANPKLRGWDGTVRSYVDYLYELSTIA